MRQDEPLEFANAGALVAEAVAQSKRYAITQLDPTGVIQRFVSADVAGEVPLWAQLMREQGLEPGDRAVVLAGRDWEWRCALLGVLYAGGVAVPCPESTPAAELRAIEADAGAAFVVSIPARPDLVDQGGPRVVSADQLETVEAAKALAHRPHSPMPGDLGLILYWQRVTGLQGTMHAHSSRVAQDDAAEHWLGLGEGERVWCTAADGSYDSIWLLLAAWRKGANIVTVDLPLDLDAQLDLLEKLHPAALWFSNEEYGALASAAPPAQVDLGSVRRALVDDESSAGAVAFEEAFGTRATPIVALDELPSRCPPTEHLAFVAISSTHLNRVRMRLYEAVKTAGYQCASYVSSSAFVWHNVTVGENTFIFENNVLQHFVEIGDNVILCSCNHIGHRSVLRSHSYLASQVVVSGFCEIGDHCFLGVNCTIADNVRVAPDCIIGAGSLILRDTRQGKVYRRRGDRESPRVSSLDLFRVRE